MKILHTADWHIGQFKGPVADGVNLRSLDTVKCLDYMVDVAKNEHPDMVCVSGDIFHQEQIGPVRYSDEMVTATRIIEELAEHSKFVIVMRGTPNHDGSGQFRVLEKMLSKNKKIAVVTTPQVISTPIADVACIPGFDKQEFRSKFPGLSAEEENLTFPETATWGLRYHEEKFGLPIRENLSPEERRKLILDRRDTKAPITPWRLEKMMNSVLGCHVKVVDIHEPDNKITHPNTFVVYLEGEGAFSLQKGIDKINDATIAGKTERRTTFFRKTGSRGYEITANPQ